MTRREKAAVWMMTILVVLVQGVLWSKAWWMPLIRAQLEMEAIGDSLQVSERGATDAIARYAADRSREEGPQSGNRKAVSACFNPNRADSLTLLRAGFSAKAASNLLKYRRRGGVFRRPADVAKIYGVTPELMGRIGDSLRFDDAPTKQLPAPSGTASPIAVREVPAVPGSLTVHTTGPGANVDRAASSDQGALALIVPDVPTAPAGSALFELNTVDTAQLQCLKGVGPVTAERIIRYRNQLGGYHHVDQLAEIKGLYPEVLACLLVSCSVDTAYIVRINLNKASLEHLKAHPYLNFYQAKVIVELRKARKGLSSLEELAAFGEFTPADLERLSWYATW